MSQITIIKAKLLFGEVLTRAYCADKLHIHCVPDHIHKLRRRERMQITTRLVRNKTNNSSHAEWWMSKAARLEYRERNQMRKAA